MLKIIKIIISIIKIIKIIRIIQQPFAYCLQLAAWLLQPAFWLPSSCLAAISLLHYHHYHHIANKLQIIKLKIIKLTKIGFCSLLPWLPAGWSILQKKEGEEGGRRGEKGRDREGGIVF
jgi:hypothetical protein